MNSFAPVIIPTLNRYEHFKRCVKSLSECALANETDLYIALDYPFHESQIDGYQKIKDDISNIAGFKSVSIMSRDVNYGAPKNVSHGIREIFKKHDKVIISEDDNVFSQNFLEFVNLGLAVYKDRKDIFSINGYTDPIDIPKTYEDDVYLWLGFAAWGCGLWKEKWEKIICPDDVVMKNVRTFLNNIIDVIRLNRIANHYVPALLLMLEQNTVHGDGYICLYQFNNNMKSIFPTISHVRNMGNDGSGINCGTLENDIYREQRIYSGSGPYELPRDIKPNKEINRLLLEHWKRSYKSQLSIIANLLLMKFGLYDPSK